MSQISKYPIRKEVADRIFEIFVKTLIKIKQKDEAEQVISDLLTPTERIMLAKRLAIALLLEKGYDYRTIKQILRVSSPTIATVNIVRQYRGNGYKQIIDKILQEEAIRDFFENAALKLLTIPAASTKGGGTYRYLKQELEKKKRERVSF